jgi:hypothetical protein
VLPILGFAFKQQPGLSTTAWGKGPIVVVVKEWVLSWDSNPRTTAPPVIKDLLDRPWNTLEVIAA